MIGDVLPPEMERVAREIVDEVPVPVIYDGVRMKSDLRLDMLVEKSIIVELKAVDQMHPVHESKSMSYMKLSKKRLGFLINFNVPVIRQGIKRIIL